MNDEKKESTHANAFLLKYRYLLILLICIAVYSNSLFFGYTDLDDDYFRLEDPQNIEKLTNPVSALTKPFMKSSYYRPAVNLTFYIDTQIADDAPFMRHFTNLIFHIAVCMALFIFFRKLNINKALALAAVLLFAVHPLNTNSVAWIVGRCDIMAGLFSILAFIFFMDFLDKNRWLCVFLTYLMLQLAVFSKETALLAPMALAAAWIFFGRKQKFGLQHAMMAALMALSFVSYFALKEAFGIPSTDTYFDLHNILHNLRVIAETVLKTVFPFLAEPLPDYTPGATIAGSIILLVLIWRLLANRKSPGMKYVVFGLLWALIFFIPALLIKYQSEMINDYFDCRAYLPLMGLLIVLAKILPPQIAELNRITSQIIYLSILIAFAIFTIHVSSKYSDPVSFWRYAVSSGPDKAVYHKYLGQSYLRAGEYEPAAMSLEKAVELDSAILSYTNIAEDLSEVYSRLGMHEKGLEITNRALSKNPKASSFLDRGNANAKAGRYREAIADFSKAIDIYPASIDAFMNRGHAFMDLGEFGSAVADFNRAIELDSNYIDAYNNRGYLHSLRGDYAAAVRDYDKILELNPNHAFAYNNRGFARFKLGDTQQALADINKSIGLAPQNSYAFKNRALINIELGNMVEACSDLHKAQELGFTSDYGPEVMKLIDKYCKPARE